MAQLDIPDSVIGKLDALRAEYNNRNKTKHTTKDWVVQHLKEIAISRELAQRAQVIQQEKEQEANDALNAALEAEKTRLMEGLT